MGLFDHLLVRLPGCVIHAALLLRLEHWHHIADAFSLADLLFAGNHAIHHAADLIGQDWKISAILSAIGFIELVADVYVNVFEPAAERVEQLLHLGVWGLAFVKVKLKAVCKLLMVFALLIQGHLVPCLDAVNAKPFKQGCNIINDFFGRVRLACNVCVDRQKEVAGLMQECGIVCVLV